MMRAHDNFDQYVEPWVHHTTQGYLFNLGGVYCQCFRLMQGRYENFINITDKDEQEGAIAHLIAYMVQVTLTDGLLPIAAGYEIFGRNAVVSLLLRAPNTAFAMATEVVWPIPISR